MQMECLAHLRTFKPFLSERSEEIERHRCRQDLAIPDAERSLENCIGAGEDVFIMARCRESGRRDNRPLSSEPKTDRSSLRMTA